MSDAFDFSIVIPCFNAEQDLLRAVQSIEDQRHPSVETIIMDDASTDGIHNLGPNPREAARRAAAQDIIIYTVTFSEDADIARMREVADITGGRHFHADTAGDLEQIFREIAQTLPVLVTK